MDMLLIVSRLLLALVFALAGVTKLFDLSGSQRAMNEFGLPTVWANMFGFLLPLAELAIAIALLPLVTAWWGALSALLLLLLFVVAISVNLVRGRKPDCHCFGQLYSAPVGWQTLTRNGILAAVASFVVWQGQNNIGPSVTGWIGDLTIGQIIGLILGTIGFGVLIAEGWVLLHSLRQNGRLLLRIEALESRLSAGVAPEQMVTIPTLGLSIGISAPTFRLDGVDGHPLTLDTLRASGKPVILVFSDPECGPCNALLPNVARWQNTHANKLLVAVISRGTLAANRAKVSEHGLVNVLLQQDREVAAAYQAHGTPSAVLIRPDGTIGSALAAGAEAIGQLITRSTGVIAPVMLPPSPSQNGNKGRSDAATLKVGDPVPMMSLPDLTGTLVDLGSFRGNMTMVLFWNPGCGFCQRMLGELKAWDANPPKGAPQLLIVSTGTVEVNHAQRLRAPVLLDPNLTVSRQFGANGTPMAVLIDAQGKVASEVVTGASDVMALANNSHK